MALLAFNPLPSLSSSPFSSCSASLPIVILPISRLRVKAVGYHPLKCSIGAQFVPRKKRSMVTMKTSAESTDGEQQEMEEGMHQCLCCSSRRFGDLICIVGLQEFKVLHVQTIKKLIERANATRSIDTTTSRVIYGVQREGVKLSFLVCYLDFGELQESVFLVNLV
ncbi:hypothetical protein HRI_001250300 [Hibiscus trionum]|uniref:Uncharacterized protein n=1 Tax=Hibiscus trionum TaxID=183268 RepID=A0A9W7HDV6_HIBTR|nr:hypothetical protein HRI_001250300 [Hibiscus trionum]